MKNQPSIPYQAHSLVPVPDRKTVFNAQPVMYAILSPASYAQCLSAKGQLTLPKAMFQARQAQLESVAFKTYSVSRMLVCYALDLTDDALCEAMSLSEAELLQETPQRVSLIASKLLAKAYTLQEELLPYGLTGEQLCEMEEAIKQLVSLSQQNDDRP